MPYTGERPLVMVCGDRLVGLLARRADQEAATWKHHQTESVPRKNEQLHRKECEI